MDHVDPNAPVPSVETSEDTSGWQWGADDEDPSGGPSWGDDGSWPSDAATGPWAPDPATDPWAPSSADPVFEGEATPRVGVIAPISSPSSESSSVPSLVSSSSSTSLDSCKCFHSSLEDAIFNCPVGDDECIPLLEDPVTVFSQSIISVDGKDRPIDHWDPVSPTYGTFDWAQCRADTMDLCAFNDMIDKIYPVS